MSDKKRKSIEVVPGFRVTEVSDEDLARVSEEHREWLKEKAEWDAEAIVNEIRNPPKDYETGE
jgi:hypothetical protein